MASMANTTSSATALGCAAPATVGGTTIWVRVIRDTGQRSAEEVSGDAATIKTDG